MEIKSKVILFFVFLIYIPFYSQTKEIDTGEIISSRDMHISLVRLIATPEKYHNKIIEVVGYLNLEFEGDAIYLHQEDYEKAILKNAFWVEFSNDINKKGLMKYNKKYVIIRGRFNMNENGHMGLFGGEIQNITRLDSWH
ncbi:hypothetical protein [Chryseobacterium daecheongense]|uniref:Uncharacterized protein n=1 Tax=Chryseobacterium daecheongense TaxID=192389 RepID=A0A3N0W3H1_9FLAO|nr:hypothetical protein [Chryseobacterium daecheongense]ROH99611.1 hypothetical protein EGI05_01590 [Chryseobacterium daecheongense]TDX95478.1 hypothetical protein BCF50_1257 [Chryseobacterium daecheongense]